MKKFLTFFFVFGIFTSIYAERCACGSMASGTTYEFSVYGSGEGGSNCCTFGLTYSSPTEPALSLSWRDNGNGTFTMTGATQMNSDEAQKACCPDIGA